MKAEDMTQNLEYVVQLILEIVTEKVNAAEISDEQKGEIIRSIKEAVKVK